MSEVIDALQGQWPWALAIALGVPVALAVASEYAFALTRRGHPLATSVWRVRNWVAPPIAVALFLRFVLGRENQIFQTIRAWLSVVGMLMMIGEFVLFMTMRAQPSADNFLHVWQAVQLGAVSAYFGTRA